MPHATHRTETSTSRRAIALGLLHFFASWAGWLARNPLAWSSVLARTIIILRQGGISALWGATLHKSLRWQAGTSHTAWYARYRRNVARTDRRRAVWPADAPHLRVVVSLARFDSHSLDRFLCSITEQSYPHWDLLCLDDCHADAESRRYAAQRAAGDHRVRIRTVSQGIETLTDRTEGVFERDAYIVLAHCVEEFAVAALATLAESVTVGHADLVYGDHVESDSAEPEISGVAALPAFSYEYFLATGYFAGCAAVRGSLVRELDKSMLEAAILHDPFELLLQLIERAGRVTHVPAIVARCRSCEYSLSGRAAAVEQHLARVRCTAQVSIDRENQVLDIRAPLVAPAAGLRVAIVIPTRNAHELLRQCVSSLESTGAFERADLWIVDHATDERAALDYLDELSRRHQIVRTSGEFNFSRLVNLGVAAASERYSHYLLLNNDIEALAHGWLDHLLTVALRPGVGAVGATLLYPEGDIQHAGVVVGMRGLAGHYQAGTPFRDERGRRVAGSQKSLVATREVSAVTAACVLVSREAWTAVGGFDETIAVGYGDVDFCLRLAAGGYRVLHDPHAVLVHHESRTRGRALWDPHPADTRLFLRRHSGAILAGDPFYSPLLSNVLAQGQLGRAWPGSPRTSTVTLPRPVSSATGIGVQAAPHIAREAA